MAEKEYVLAVDSGTQSIRAVLFDVQGNELAIEQAQYDPYFSLQPGWAEQRTEDYWSKFCQVTKGLLAKVSIDPGAIAGVGITTQRNTVIPMDKEGNALRPAIIWLDQRVVSASLLWVLPARRSSAQPVCSTRSGMRRSTPSFYGSSRTSPGFMRRRTSSSKRPGSLSGSSPASFTTPPAWSPGSGPSTIRT